MNYRSIPEDLSVTEIQQLGVSAPLENSEDDQAEHASYSLSLHSASHLEMK